MKTIICSLVPVGAAALATVASASPYTMYSPYHVPPVAVCPAPVAVVPAEMVVPEPAAVMLPPLPMRVTADARGFFGFRGVPHSRYATDIFGLELELGYHVSPRNAFTLTLSGGAGGDDRTNFIDTPHGPRPVSEDYLRSDFNLMLGYRFTQPLSDRVRVSFGLKGGLDVQGLSYEDFRRDRSDGYWDGYYGPGCRDTEVTCGFAYAASVMLETQLSPRCFLLVGYQYKGATTEPDTPSVVPHHGSDGKARAMSWHEAHLGVRVRF